MIKIIIKLIRTGAKPLNSNDNDGSIPTAYDVEKGKFKIIIFNYLLPIISFENIKNT